jgi:hypothetical protein
MPPRSRIPRQRKKPIVDSHGRHPIRREVTLPDGRTGTLTDTQCAFLAAFRATGFIGRSSDAVGIDRANHSIWRNEDAFYSAAFEAAKEDIADEMESAARDRAIKGVTNIKFAKNGTPIIDPRKCDENGKIRKEWADDPWYYEHQYSDKLLELLLRAKRPNEFRSNFSHEVSGPGGAPMELDVAARQMAIANPMLAQQMCEALEHVHYLEQSGKSLTHSGGDGNPAGVGMDGQQGPLPVGSTPVPHQPEVDGFGVRENQKIDDFLSPPPREE